jgi:site-specific recombinase XerC
VRWTGCWLVCASSRRAAASDKAKSRALRLACLIEVLYATGLRVSELVSLTVGMVSGDDRFIVVRGKGGRERLVPSVTCSAPRHQCLACRISKRKPMALICRPASTCLRHVVKKAI